MSEISKAIEHLKSKRVGLVANIAGIDTAISALSNVEKGAGAATPAKASWTAPKAPAAKAAWVAPKAAPAAKARTVMSAAGRARIAAAQKARWAAIRAG